jgi:hypothetical protein
LLFVLQDYLVLFFNDSAVLSVHSIFRKVRNHFISNGFSTDSFEEDTGEANYMVLGCCYTSYRRICLCYFT